jgi:hypothetical protein
MKEAISDELRYLITTYNVSKKTEAFLQCPLCETKYFVNGEREVREFFDEKGEFDCPNPDCVHSSRFRATKTYQDHKLLGVPYKELVRRGLV